MTQGIPAAVRGVCAVGSAACFLFGVMPLYNSRFHAGLATLLAAGVLLAAIAFFPQAVTAVWQAVGHSRPGRILRGAVIGIVVCLLALFVAVSTQMVLANYRPPQENATVIVLGAGLRGDRPARMLQARLDAAADYLLSHPSAACVVSGGQNFDEICTEASVMRRYLEAAGVAPERIYEEDRSASTFENLQFSRRVIEENGLNPAVALATQSFHQCRAGRFACRAGLTEFGALTAETPWYQVPGYWIRDFAGLCHMVLLGT